MTLGERLDKATGWTARHVISDEIANFGKNYEIGPYLESKIQNAERADKLREFFGQPSGIVSIGNGLYARTRDAK